MRRTDSMNRPRGQTPAPARRGWSIAALIVAILAFAAGLLIGGLTLLWGGASLATGAPEPVLLSILRQMYVIALPVVAPPALAGAALAIVGLVRGRRGRGLAIAALGLALVCVVVLLIGLPLLSVEPCFDLGCAI
jgi:membrane protease YdiL (CAAX protease family)